MCELCQSKQKQKARKFEFRKTIRLFEWFSNTVLKFFYQLSTANLPIHIKLVNQQHQIALFCKPYKTEFSLKIMHSQYDRNILWRVHIFVTFWNVFPADYKCRNCCLTARLKINCVQNARRAHMFRVVYAHT